MAGMRILILNDKIPPENVGGAGRVAWNLAVGLRDRGHEVHVIAATEGPAFEELREGIPTCHIHSRYPPRFQAWLSLWNPQTAGPLRRLYERIRPDVVNAHNIHYRLSYHALTLAHSMGLRTVFNAHDVMPFAYNRLRHFIDPAHCGLHSPQDYRLPPFYNLREARLRYNPFRNFRIRRVLAHHTDARICVSQAHRDSLQANGLPPFQVVYNGVDPAQFDIPDAEVTALRKRLGLEGRQVILLAGRLSADKGGRQLLQALARLVERRPQALLLLLGPAGSGQQGRDDPQLRHLWDGHIRAGGWLHGAELAAAFRLADVVATPSVILDCFPTVNLEAMAAGTPVIATCYGGSPEAVVDGQTGYIVNPFDTEQFADRLEALLSDDELRARMGAAARAHVQTHFSLAAQLDTMEAIYRGV